MPEEGDNAGFSTTDADGNPVKLSDFRGQKGRPVFLSKRYRDQKKSPVAFARFLLDKKINTDDLLTAKVRKLTGVSIPLGRRKIRALSPSLDFGEITPFV